MADKIQKALAKLNPKDREAVDAIIRRLHVNDIAGLDVKQIVGHADVFRVRKGKLRIIYIATENGNRILKVSGRNEKTYREF